MAKNKISAVLSDTDKAAILTSIKDVKTGLSFLVNMSTKEKGNTRKMGPKSIEYVNLNLQGAQSFSDLIPSSVDTVEFAKDVTLVNQLLPIKVELMSILETVNDSIVAAGSDAMQTSDRVYDYLKSGAENNASVKALVAQIAKRFEGQGKKKKDM